MWLATSAQMPEEVGGHCSFGWKWAAAWGVAAAFLALATPELSMDPWSVLPLPDVRRSWAPYAPWARIHIVEAHGEVLRHWPTESAAKPNMGSWSEPVTLVHIDSHSDMAPLETNIWADFLEDIEDCDAHCARMHRKQWQKAAADKVFVSDFITAALWLGLLDRIIWIRSDLPGMGRYNGPPPGRYKAQVEWNLWTSEGEVVFEELCLRQLEVLEVFPLTELTGIMVHEAFDSCTEVEEGAAERELLLHRNFTLTVGTLFQVLKRLQDGLWTASSVLQSDKSRAWILDLDLDTFSTYDPALRLMQEANFSQSFVEKAADLLNTNRACSQSHNESLIGCGCLSSRVAEVEDYRAALLQNLSQLPAALRAAPGDQQRQLLLEGLADCEVDTGASEMLANLSTEEGERWRWVFETALQEGFDDDLAKSMLEGAMGVHHVSRSEAVRHLEAFHDILGYVAQVPPEVVTISRSRLPRFNRYLPESLWPMVEHQANTGWQLPCTESGTERTGGLVPARRSQPRAFQPVEFPRVLCFSQGIMLAGVAVEFASVWSTCTYRHTTACAGECPAKVSSRLGLRMWTQS
ncbi:unnamed protein product [Symbiodinium sp. CCMP2592]|nr:unnamed protein product [Symbiodinium sp. CCMP2592]